MSLRDKFTMASWAIGVVGLGGSVVYGIVETPPEARAAVNACRYHKFECRPDQVEIAKKAHKAEMNALKVSGGSMAVMIIGTGIGLSGPMNNAPQSPVPTPAPKPMAPTKPYTRPKSMTKMKKRA